MQTGPYTMLTERGDEIVSADPRVIQDLHDVEVPGMRVLVLGHAGTLDLGYRLEQLVVEPRQLTTAGVEIVDRRELVDPHGSLYVREVVLESRHHDLDLRRSALGVAIPCGPG